MTKKMTYRKSDIPANGLKECEGEGGAKVLIVNSGSEYFAVQAHCPHQEIPLCEGILDGTVLTCHQHLWQWDLRTGEPQGLAEAPIERYEVTVEEDDIVVGGKIEEGVK
jgi:toluene monooxygenase system ferredoxin subunit